MSSYLKGQIAARACLISSNSVMVRLEEVCCMVHEHFRFCLGIYNAQLEVDVVVHNKLSLFIAALDS